ERDAHQSSHQDLSRHFVLPTVVEETHPARQSERVYFCSISARDTPTLHHAFGVRCRSASGQVPAYRNDGLRETRTEKDLGILACLETATFAKRWAFSAHATV